MAAQARLELRTSAGEGLSRELATEYFQQALAVFASPSLAKHARPTVLIRKELTGTTARWTARTRSSHPATPASFQSCLRRPAAETHTFSKPMSDYWPTDAVGPLSQVFCKLAFPLALPVDSLTISHFHCPNSEQFGAREALQAKTSLERRGTEVSRARANDSCPK